MFSTNQKIIAALDIGGTKIACCIAKTLSSGKIEVLGISTNASEGIRHGSIGDMKLVRSSVAAAIYEAERKAKQHIDSVIVNVSSPLIKSNLAKIVTHFNGKQILASALQNIERRALHRVDTSQFEILTHTTLWHDLDEMQEVHDPEFMFANTLISFVNIITIPPKHLINLSCCLLGCQLKISSFVMSSFASSLVCATDEEREAGCLVIDIGGETLNYISIKHNKIINSGTVPLAGKAITRDIAQYFSLSFAEAERLKILYGRLYDFISDENNIIKIQNSATDEPISITNAVLNKVIKARFEEIMSLFLSSIKKNKMNESCFNNIIFTGGTSKFDGLENFLNQSFGLKIRKGSPIYIDTTCDKEPEFSTLLGMLKCVTRISSSNQTKKPSIKTALVWLKENF